MLTLQSYWKDEEIIAWFPSLSRILGELNTPKGKMNPTFTVLQVSSHFKPMIVNQYATMYCYGYTYPQQDLMYINV